MTTVARGGPDHLDGAARVWAEGTAARDGASEAASPLAARPRLAEILDEPESLFVVALNEEYQVVAFALAGLVVEPGSAARTADLRYVGVLPRLWGAGLGSLVLRRLTDELASAGFDEARLMVYVDNPRAVRLYQRHGWRPAGPPTPCPRTGKPEQRYRLPIISRAVGPR